jgi:hypothetical protein
VATPGFPLLLALIVSAALGLLEEGGENAGEGHDEGDAEESDPRGAPEGNVAGRAGLLRDVGEGEREGDQGQKAESCSENVEVATHGAGTRISRVRCRKVVGGVMLGG